MEKSAPDQDSAADWTGAGVGGAGADKSVKPSLGVIVEVIDWMVSCSARGVGDSNAEKSSSPPALGCIVEDPKEEELSGSLVLVTGSVGSSLIAVSVPDAGLGTATAFSSTGSVDLVVGFSIPCPIGPTSAPAGIKLLNLKIADVGETVPLRRTMGDA